MLIAKIFNVKTKILEQIYPKEYGEYVEKYSKECDVDSLLIFSIIKAESNFKSNAVSSSGAIGLMQIMEPTAQEISQKMALAGAKTLQETIDLYNAETNIMYGTQYYTYLLQMVDGNIKLALAAYNAGIGTVNKWIEEGIIKDDGSDIENIPYKETNMYVRKILNNYEMYKKLYG
jgi:soluble lytic murein transglycosylase